MKIKVWIFALFFLGLAVQAWAGCPTNEVLQNTQTPIIFSYEKRDGTGEDTTNIGNKRIAFSYYNGTAWRWYNGTDWTATSESLLTMAQLTGGQYYYLLPAAALSSTVTDKYIVTRFDEIDDVDVTMSCLSYVQPEKRLTITKVWDEPKSGHTTAGTFGYYLDAQVSAAGGGSDPWGTALPGAYGAGTAGNIVGNRLDAAVSSRMASGNVTVGGYAAGQAPADSVLATPANKLATDGTGRVTVGSNADKTGYSLTQAFPTNFSALSITGGGAVTAGTVSDKAGYSLSAAGVDAIWDEARAGHTTAGTFGYYLDAPVSTAGGAGSSDWTTDEKNQLRYRLGVDGTTAVPAATPNMGTLTANVADKTGFSLAADQSGVTVGTVGTVTDKAGYSLSAAGVDAILNDTIEGSYTMRQILCAAAAVLYGKASGGATTTITFRNMGDTLNRVSETVDANGNRTAITLNLTGCQ